MDDTHSDENNLDTDNENEQPADKVDNHEQVNKAHEELDTNPENTPNVKFDNQPDYNKPGNIAERKLADKSDQEQDYRVEDNQGNQSTKTKLTNKMVEIREDEVTDSWDSGSYSEAMKKFRDSCLGVKRMDKQFTGSEEEKENIHVDNGNGKGNDDGVTDGKDSVYTWKSNITDHSEIKGDDNCARNLDMLKGNDDTKKSIEERYSPDENKTKKGNLINKAKDNVGAETNIYQNSRLTEKNLKMFTKMQSFPYNMDMTTASHDGHQTNLRKRHHQEVKSERCPSAEGSGNESAGSKYDSENDRIPNNSHNPQFMKALLDSKSDMMRFAEVLYKCTLCTTLPSIFTSKSSFIKHVRENHFTVDSQFKVCNICFLKFKTDEDLKRHVVCVHTGSDRLSPLETGSDVIRPRFCNTPGDNESDSDSSGHRSYKAKIVRRSKPPVSDFENPKQLVDHAGIETLNGSLDLSKKESKSIVNKCDTKTSVHKAPHERSSPHCLNAKSPLNVQQITDQIIQSNLHGRNIQSQSEQRLPFTPSYTPEFGKYTKLVREGGNIVYFCQVCNWMSPVKAHFQAHCGSVSHSKKVKSTNDQEQGSDSKSDTSASKDRGSPSKNPNVCIGGYESKYGPSSHPSILNIPSTSTYSKLHEASMFYSYIRPRTLTHCGRTPVVSGQGFQERSDLMFQKHGDRSDLPLNIPFRKRKRPKEASSTTIRQSNSESDSEDISGDKDHSSRCSPASMSLLRSKLLQGQSKNDKMSSGSVKDNFSSGENNMKSGTLDRLDLHADTLVRREYREENDFEKCSIAKRKKDNVSPINREKHRKTDNSDHNDKRVNETDYSLFKLYRCVSCPFEYSNLDEYEKHFTKVHIASGQSMGSPQRSFQHLFSSMGSSGLTPQGQHEGHVEGQSEGQSVRSDLTSGSGNMEMGENWRVQKLKEILPDFLEVNEKGNTSRDFLLQCICVSCGIPDAALWSSACNKAVREVFPSSMAQRKGKYKNYYFGLSMSESFQGQDDFNPLDPDGQLYQPIRDINADMEKIMEQLPTIIHWNGCMDSGVYRSDILSVLEDLLDEPDVLTWGTQCNRAIKLVFPMVDMKRKGKFKTTKYFGVSFNKNIGQIPGKPDCNSSIAEISNSKEEKQDTEKSEELPGEITPIQPITKKDNPSTNPNREPADSENHGGSVPVFPEWFKEEAQSQMKQYLTKFGGVFDDGSGKNHDKMEDDDNDGDDEGESVDEAT